MNTIKLKGLFYVLVIVSFTIFLVGCDPSIGIKLNNSKSHTFSTTCGEVKLSAYYNPAGLPPALILQCPKKCAVEINKDLIWAKLSNADSLILADTKLDSYRSRKSKTFRLQFVQQVALQRPMVARYIICLGDGVKCNGKVLVTDTLYMGETFMLWNIL